MRREDFRERGNILCNNINWICMCMYVSYSSVLSKVFFRMGSLLEVKLYFSRNFC